jgi:Zinc dependent phospholipase C
VHQLLRICGVVVLLLALLPPASAYSVLTHEEIIDLAWDKDIVPLIRERFPDATDEDLKEAHAYAYGGAVIQDLGYYPFGSHTFSDLVHYVRSGDFVINLINESDNINQYAFALGALAHYASDITGHPAVNQAVAIEFPKLRAKYGRVVTYAEDHSAHLEVEFGFDVSQVGKGRYAPQSYHDFIGFKVSKPQLERAFKDTYGVELTDVIKHEDLALGTYRRSVSKIIPQMTKVAVASREQELKSEIPDYNRKKFLYRLSRAQYEKEWGKGYERPGVGARILAVVLKFMPKVGPFRGLAYKNPTPQTQDLYFKSVNATSDYYAQLTKQLHNGGTLDLKAMDLDTGKPTRPGEYSLSDDTYAGLVDRVAQQEATDINPDVREKLLLYYSGQEGKPTPLKDPKKQSQLENDLQKLRATPVQNVAQQSVAAVPASR